MATKINVFEPVSTNLVQPVDWKTTDEHLGVRVNQLADLLCVLDDQGILLNNDTVVFL